MREAPPPAFRRGLSLALAQTLGVLHYARYPAHLLCSKANSQSEIHLLGLEILTACDLYTSDFNLFALNSYPHYLHFFFSLALSN